MNIWREFRFEAAHRLPNLPPEHKCSRLHGHSFKFKVEADLPLDDHLGWAMDFGDLDKLVRPTVDALDHRYLNDIPGLENPTSEVLAIWLWDHLSPVVPGLSAITVQETCRNACIYRGNLS